MATTIIEHDFTVGSNVALTAYTEEGIGYVQVFVGWTETARVNNFNDAVASTGNESNVGYIYRVDLATTNADYSVEALSHVNNNHNKRPNIMFGRITNADNWYALARYSAVDSPNLVLAKKVGGTYTELATSDSVS